MLQDAVIDHDLAKIRIDLLKDQRQVDLEERRHVSGKDDDLSRSVLKKPSLRRPFEGQLPLPKAFGGGS
jgi:hypothetical protein